MPENGQIILDPHLHQDGARRFMEHFYVQPKPPGLEYLQEILIHFGRIPYENISKIIKLKNNFYSPERIRLPEEVIEEHARFGFGGTCFSLTFFLQTILTNLGYRCYPVIAHMRNRPNVHCALVVMQGHKKYLIDPGYLLTTPMALVRGKTRLYRTPHTGVELQFNRDDEHFHISTFDKQTIKWRYCFRDEPLPPHVFLLHWHDSFYQGTMHGICLTLAKGNGLVYLHNDHLQITSMEGKKKAKIRENYPDTIRSIFGIPPEFVEEALLSIKQNKEMERQYGLFQAGKK